MGIWESLNEQSGRSAGSVDDILGVVKGYFHKKRADEMRQKIKERFTQVKATQGQAPTAPRMVPQNPEVSSQNPVEGNAQSDGVEQLTPSPITGPRVEPKTQMRGIESLDDVYALGDMLNWNPEKTVGMATQEQERLRQQRQKKTMFAPQGSRIVTVDAEGNLQFGGDVPRTDTAVSAYEDFRSKYPKTPEGQNQAAMDWEEMLQKGRAKDERQWVIRNGRAVYDVAQPNDVPYEKPASAESVQTHRDAEASRQRTEQRMTEDRITKLTQRNQSLGQQLRQLGVNLFLEPGTKNVIKNDSETAKSLKVGWEQEIMDNEKEIERLNQKIGGRFKAGSQTTGQGSGGVDGYTVQPSQAALNYLEQNKNDARVRQQFLEKYGALPTGY